MRHLCLAQQAACAATEDGAGSIWVEGGLGPLGGLGGCLSADLDAVRAMANW